MIDTSKTERISYDYWINSQLSIARFSGGCKLNGVMYYVDPTSGNDLVRADVLKREQKARRVAEKAAKQQAK